MNIIENIKEIPFVHLHVHTDYSLLDGEGRIPQYIKKAKKCGMQYAAITDHDTMAGVVEFHDTCIKNDINPVLGVETRIVEDIKSKEKGRHLVLFAENDIGYANLCHLISQANIHGFYRKPRIDKRLLEKYHEGIICLSACIAGSPQQYIIKGNIEKAKEEVLYYKNLFKDNFYLEIQNHGLEKEEVVRKAFYEIAEEYHIKMVCTNDCHYVNHEDMIAHDWLLCIQTGKTIMDKDRMRYHGDYSFLSAEEMYKNMIKDFKDDPEKGDKIVRTMMQNTVEIASKCKFRFSYGNYRMPNVSVPTEYEKFEEDKYYEYMKDLAWKGFHERYGSSNEDYQKRATEELSYELGIVKSMGFSKYFLDIRETIIGAKSKNYLVGPGRGSAAGSRLCYCLRITDIDPIRYDLLFERFLNPERVSMPDIDTDFDFAHKDEIIMMEARRNGFDKFAKIQTFTTLLAKGILRDVVRINDYPVAVGNKLSSLIPDKMTLQEAYDTNKELQDYLQKNPEYQPLFERAKELEGIKKAASTHACGHIPTPVPCEDLFPVSVDKESGLLICQYNMTDAEHLGNLKKDLLMLRNLTIIDQAQNEIKRLYGVDVPLWTDEIVNDQKALELISRGETNGIFQIESDGMKAFMKNLKPNCFEDIIAGVALYRPGPMEYIDDYIRGKYHPETITYLTPKLEPILKNTYGIIVYQEQVSATRFALR